MLTKKSIRFIQEVIAPQRDDILSLYLDINPAKVTNQKTATFIRTKNELNALGLPKTLIDKVLKKLENAYAFPQARTLVLFASRDQTLLEHHTLPYTLPVLQNKDVLAKYGQPYVTPLLQTLDTQRTYGVVFVDEVRWRYFEISFGQIEELQDAFRALDTREWRKLTEASRGVVGIAARGGMGKDHVERRKGAWTHRFYKEVARRLEHRLENHKITAFFLMGQAKHIHEFKDILSKSTLEKLAECVSPPAKSNATANEILPLIQPCIASYEQRLERALLAQIKEEGLWGLGATLEALQAGKLQLVIAPLSHDQTIYICSETLYVTSSLGNLEQHCPGQHHQLALLQDVLPDLVARHGAQLTYVHGEVEDTFVQTFGLAGLKRWRSLNT